MSAAESAATQILPRSRAGEVGSPGVGKSRVVEHRSCKNQKHMLKGASGSVSTVEEQVNGESRTVRTDQVQCFQDDDDVFDALKHYPMPLDSTPIKRSLLDILASVPPIPVAASSSREAVDGAQVEGHSVEVHIANSRQSLVTGNYDVGTQGDTATNIRFLSSSPGKKDIVREERISQKDSSSGGSPDSCNSSQHALHLDYLSEDGDEAENPGSPNSVSSSSANADTTEDESHLTSVESPQSEEERSSDVADMTTLAYDNGEEQVGEIESVFKRVDEPSVTLSTVHTLQSPMEAPAIIPLRGIPERAGIHLRFQEDGTAKESPRRRRTVLRGLPPPVGNHLSFED